MSRRRCTALRPFRLLLPRQHVLDVSCTCQNALSEHNGLLRAEELEWTKLLEDVIGSASLQEFAAGLRPMRSQWSHVL